VAADLVCGLPLAVLCQLSTGFFPGAHDDESWRAAHRGYGGDGAGNDVDGLLQVAKGQGDMSAALVMGPVLLGMGVLIWTVSGWMAGLATNMHLGLRPEDAPYYRIRKHRQVKITATVGLAVGAILVIYGLITGK
jgi:hypothetical protein